MSDTATGRVVVVGIGADGYDGLAGPARAAIDEAAVVIGGQRQLDLLPSSVGAQRVPWPSPLRPAVRRLVEQHRVAAAGEGGLVVLASGDPMHHGIGRTLLEELGPGSIRVLPHPSSVSLACARLGWPVEATPVVSTLTAGLESVLRHAGDGRRLLVLNRDSDTPPALAALLSEHGFGASRLLVLADLGGPGESSHQGLAEQADYWAEAWPRPTGPSITAVQLAGPASLPEAPGLPDDSYWHDGQLTKRHVRALTLAALAPRPGEQLWDVGGGSGSIAVEWLRAHATTRAVSVEKDETRVQRITRNAAHLGVPHLRVVTGAAPAALTGLPTPDAVFIGGGLTADGVFEACWSALREGGRLVANAVTLESQAEVTRLAAQHGGELVKVEIAGTTPVGGFTGWRPAMPVVQWTVVKGVEQ